MKRSGGRELHERGIKPAKATLTKAFLFSALTWINDYNFTFVVMFPFLLLVI